MWKALFIGYAVIAAMVFITMMVLLCHAWEKDSKDPYSECYPEEAGSDLVAVAIFFIVALLMGLMWPLCPVILIGVFVYDKIEEKYPGLCGREEEDEPGTNR